MSEVNLEQVKNLANLLSYKDRLELLKYLEDVSNESEKSIKTKPQSLRGAWTDAFADTDIDKELNSIRNEWQKEWLLFQT